MDYKVSFLFAGFLSVALLRHIFLLPLAPPLVRTPIDLRFSPSGKFVILQLTDLHYGEPFEGQDTNTTKLMEKLIEASKPDMIVVTGDLVTGYEWDGRNFTFYQSHWAEFTGVFKRMKVPYALALGNHDSEANLNRKEIMRLDSTNEFSLFPGDQGSDSEAGSDFLVRVKSSKKSEKTSALVWILDTLRRSCGPNAGSWGCLKPTQLAWLGRELEKEITEHGSLKGLAFMHIPPPEFVPVFSKFPTSGNKNQTVSCPTFNNNMVDLMAKSKHFLALFCGHDHNNDFAGSWNGVDLVYGRKTGYGGYGPIGLRGGRVIELKEKNEEDLEYSSWVIDEELKIWPDVDRAIQVDKTNQTHCAVNAKSDI